MDAAWNGVPGVLLAGLDRARDEAIVQNARSTRGSNSATGNVGMANQPISKVWQGALE